jgi:serralysin
MPPRKPRAKSKQSQPTLSDLRVCVDRYLPTNLHKIYAAGLAVSENPANAPVIVKDAHPLSLALLTGKMWANGRVLTCYFMEGSAVQKKKVEEQAHKIEQYANIFFKFVDDPSADIRISFKRDEGSYSYIGTDCISIPKNENTINFGWLEISTEDEEYERVVVHEFLHAIGCVHEMASPAGGIEWNKDAVYKLYSGSPNYWTKEEIDINVIMKYSVSQTQFSKLDPTSIMMYPVPASLCLNGFSSGWNTTMSPTDKEFLSLEYPKIPLLGINQPSVSYTLAKDEPIDFQLNVPSNQSNLFLINTDPKHVWLSVFDGNTEKNKKVAWGKGSAQFNSSGAKYIVRARFEKGHEGAFSIWCSKPGSL